MMAGQILGFTWQYCFICHWSPTYVLYGKGITTGPITNAGIMGTVPPTVIFCTISFRITQYSPNGSFGYFWMPTVFPNNLYDQSSGSLTVLYRYPRKKTPMIRRLAPVKNSTTCITKVSIAMIAKITTPKITIPVFFMIPIV